MKQVLSNLKVKILNARSEGSAITEFLIFTLPFFTAILFMAISINEKSMAISEAKNLARQSVRAYVSSPSDQLAQVRADQVITLYADMLSEGERYRREFILRIKCSQSPCLSAGAQVTATIEVNIHSNENKSISSSVTAQATEFVDLWR